MVMLQRIVTDCDILLGLSKFSVKYISNATFEKFLAFQINVIKKLNTLFFCCKTMLFGLPQKNHAKHGYTVSLKSLKTKKNKEKEKTD